MEASTKKLKRDFIFIDESGDPGHQRLQGSSDHYMVTALHVTNISIREMTGHFSRMRYLQGLTKELKEVYKNPVLLKFVLHIYAWLKESYDVACTSGYLEKSKYTGPYLSENGYGGYDPQKFRNYILRRVLERHFHIHQVLSEEVEIVIDRFHDNTETESELFKYLGDNYNLPNILHLVQVDSRYVEGIQLSDLITRVIKAKKVDDWQDIDSNDLDFAEIVCLNQIPKGFPYVIYSQ